MHFNLFEQSFSIIKSKTNTLATQFAIFTQNKLTTQIIWRRKMWNRVHGDIRHQAIKLWNPSGYGSNPAESTRPYDWLTDSSSWQTRTPGWMQRFGGWDGAVGNGHLGRCHMITTLKGGNRIGKGEHQYSGVKAQSAEEEERLRKIRENMRPGYGRTKERWHKSSERRSTSRGSSSISISGNEVNELTRTQKLNPTQLQLPN